MMDLSELYRIAEQDNIAVDCFDLGSREALSYMDQDGDCFIAIDPFCLTSSSDEKMKLAHELGHCETGSFYNQWAAADLREKREYKANKWAIKKLLPEEELRAALRAGYTEPWQLADYFDVTEDMVRRAAALYQILRGE